jgi:hypothetical protein
MNRTESSSRGSRHVARFKAPRAVAFCEKIGRHPTGKPNDEWAPSVATSTTPVSGSDQAMDLSVRAPGFLIFCGTGDRDRPR